MKKLALYRETVRKLDENVMEKIHGGGKTYLVNTTRGKACPLLTCCYSTC